MKRITSKKNFELKVEIQGETVEDVVDRLEDLVARMKYERNCEVLHSIGARHYWDIHKVARGVNVDSGAKE